MERKERQRMTMNRLMMSAWRWAMLYDVEDVDFEITTCNITE